MKRGAIWIVSGAADYAGNILSRRHPPGRGFDATDSITICAFTTDATEAPLFRLPVVRTPAMGCGSPAG